MMGTISGMALGEVGNIIELNKNAFEEGLYVDRSQEGIWGSDFFFHSYLGSITQPDFPVADEGSKRIPCYRSPRKHVVILLVTGILHGE